MGFWSGLLRGSRHGSVLDHAVLLILESISVAFDFIYLFQPLSGISDSGLPLCGFPRIEHSLEVHH